MALFKFKKGPSVEAQPESTKQIVDMPIIFPDLEARSFGMHTAAGEKYTFVLSGSYLYLPNKASRCGYGSDDWMLAGKCGDKYCILYFSDNAGYGTAWSVSFITEETALLLPEEPGLDWLEPLYKSDSRIFGLHPDSLDEAREIIKSKGSRTGPLTDNKLYGQY